MSNASEDEHKLNPGKNGVQQLKFLFSYTQFHLALCAVLSVLLIAFAAGSSSEQWASCRPLLWMGIAGILVSGWAGAVVAAIIPRRTMFSEFWQMPAGPFGAQWWRGAGWTYLQHAAFWSAIVAIALAFLLAPGELRLAPAMQAHDQFATATITEVGNRVQYQLKCTEAKWVKISTTNGEPEKITWPKNLSKCAIFLGSLDKNGKNLPEAMDTLTAGQTIKSYTSKRGSQYLAFLCGLPPQGVKDECILEFDR